MSLSGRLIRSLIRIAVLLAIAFAGMWIAVSRPILPDRLHRKDFAMVDPSRLKQHVKILSSDFAPRDFRHPEKLELTAVYIRKIFQQSGGEVYEHSYEVEGIPYKNVIAEYGPDSPSAIVIGAHYDAVVGTPGADDNASGVAGVLELARLFSTVSFSSKVILAAYTLEEPPFFASNLMGSAVHARALIDENVDVKLMICFEMIGYFSDTPGSQHFPIPFLKLYYPSAGNFITVVDHLFSTQAGRMKRWMQKSIDLPIYSINAPKWFPGIDWSDHKNFWDQGYPAIMITDTAFYRNEAYHSASDTSDRLDYERMAKVVQGVYTYVLHLAEGTEHYKQL